MIERRITFVIGDEGIPVWKLNQLKTLAGYFRSVVVMMNITRLLQANVEETFRVMSLGSRPGDLCQLLIEGSDAELACMVLTDFVAEQFSLVKTGSRKKSRYALCVESHDENNPTFFLPFEMSFTYQELTDEVGVEDKSALIERLCRMMVSGIEPEKVEHKASLLFDLLSKREAVSSTAMGNGIALPHVMSDAIEQPAMAVIRLPKPVDWASNRGSVSLLIAMLLPAPPQRPHIQAFSHFSRSLLEPDFCQLLTANRVPDALKAVILHTLSKAFSDNT
ncbi:PTS sugar transporter subunit IIA [Photobacterium sp. J15]|uniref:PTS sugar transporter subunit IIA n=1 Tax=Photobacterium sp. J15 TaxID=265901 RepID=UPI0007E3AAE6|nr:PTS sugar transporter subunit IIA [Photobacterium sp. J15]